MDSKEQFIESEFLASTLRGAFQRVKIYEKNTSENDKDVFRKMVRSLLVDIGKRYTQEEVPVLLHIENIAELKKNMNSHLPCVLQREITFGTAQKLLNLYLKYLWCWGYIPIPPHCPVDSVVLKEAKVKDVPPWSKMCKEDYLKAIKQIEKHASPDPIAEWELRMFNRENLAYGLNVEESIKFPKKGF